MRRLAAIGLGLVAVIAFAAAVPAGGEDGERYLVRAVFDNGVVHRPRRGRPHRRRERGHGRVGGRLDAGGGRQPHAGRRGADGKAIVVLDITDPGFQDFRTDATCILRPQSLIGERYVACRPTRPRPPGSPQPPPLEQVPDGEAGEGQYLLPLENNGKTVDIDLVQNVMRFPTRERLRLILNDLGAGFAARGDELAEIVRRADPTLRDGDRVLAILARQRSQLADLASDSERILAPLSRERDHVAGFIENAGETAAATAERRADLELDLARFPGFLRELRTTMGKFQGFSRPPWPVPRRSGGGTVVDRRDSGPWAPSRTPRRWRHQPRRRRRADGTQARRRGPDHPQGQGPGAHGREAEQGPRSAPSSQAHRGLRAADGPDLQHDRVRERLRRAGHFLRTTLIATNCVDYSVGWASGCDARFEASGRARARRSSTSR